MRDNKHGTQALLGIGREMHLLDVENLLGRAGLTADDVQTLRPTYTDVSGMVPEAHVVVATSNEQTIVEAGLGWVGSRRTFKPGRDGADLALLEVAQEQLAVRYDRLVIGSGDHIFAPLAANLIAAGRHVTVVSRREALSMQLRMAVRDIRYLPETTIVSARRTLPADMRPLVREAIRRAA